MEDITFKLIETFFQVSRLIKEGMSCDGEFSSLSPLQFHALMFLHQSKEVSMSAIAEHFRIELPSATSLVATLCDNGLAQRQTSSDDRRLVLISLTKKGEILLEETKKIHRVKLEKNLSLFTDQEKLNLLTLLQSLQNRLQK